MPNQSDPLAKEIGQRIAKMRKEFGWTQETAAEHAGLSQQYLASVEQGHRGLGYKSIIKLCKTFDCSADYLLTGRMTQQETALAIQMLDLMSESQRGATMGVIRSILIAHGYDPPDTNVKTEKIDR